MTLRIPQQNYLKQIYPEADGFIGYMHIDENEQVQTKMISVDSILDETYAGKNKFLTLNTFSSASSRKTQNLQSINALYLDIDAYHVGLTLNEALKQMKKHEFGRNVPYPTYITKSGQGLYLIWQIEPLPASKLDVWNATQKALHNALRKYGSDSKSLDASRVLRVPGSINGKEDVNSEVVIKEYNPVIYDFEDIKNWVVSETEITVPNSYKHFEKRNNGGEGRSRAWNSVAENRAADIATVLKAMGKNVVGYREKGLFYYRHFLLQAGLPADASLQMTLSLNSSLAYPLKETEAITATKTPLNKWYNPSNDTLIEEFRISPTLQKSLLTIYSKDEKANRRRQRAGRQISKADEIMQRRTLFAELVELGRTMKEICTILSCSKSTYYNILKEVKAICLAQKTSAAKTPAIISAVASYIIESITALKDVAKTIEEPTHNFNFCQAILAVQKWFYYYKTANNIIYPERVSHNFSP